MDFALVPDAEVFQFASVIAGPMTFTSLTFLIFFPMVFLLHWMSQKRAWQNSILVLASYFFYGWWDYRFCALMLFSSLVDYAIGMRIANAPNQTQKKVALWLSIACNLGLLGFFKYFNFFTESLVAALGDVGWTVHPMLANILLPVGISFYTFQTLSYSIDIYRDKLQPTRNLIDYLAFVSFFPQLVAGPIERATNLIPQFSRARTFSNEEAIAGCRLILWGFVKKLIVADRLATVVDAAYASPHDASGLTLFLATVFFAFQIYCDFSAYSDIAIGTAKLFRINLMRNFDYPYFSQSVTEFWRRWHISLSTWFRDYVFIPLGGSRGSTNRTNFNLMLTFVLSGLWHGAAWRFIAWGAINGTALVVEKSFSTAKPVTIRSNWQLPRLVVAIAKTSCTFLVICFSWIFFRADSLSAAFMILKKIIRSPFNDASLAALQATIEFHSRIESSLLIIIAFATCEWLNRTQANPLSAMKNWSTPYRWATYTLLIWGTLKFMITTRMNPFIYFTF